MKHKVPNAFYRGKKSKFQTILPWDKNLGWTTHSGCIVWPDCRRYNEYQGR
jgi:hypothetical protein